MDSNSRVLGPLPLLDLGLNLEIPVFKASAEAPGRANALFMDPGSLAGGTFRGEIP